MMELQPGDLLLYPPTSLMGWLIAWKTWSRPPISHVEVYLGNGQSAAARGDGVNIYRLRSDYSMVMRPQRAFNAGAAREWLETVRGQKYDYLGLFIVFIAVRQGAPDKMYCSELATRLYRAGGLEPFHPDFDADRAAPATFLASGAFDKVVCVCGKQS